MDDDAAAGGHVDGGLDSRLGGRNWNRLHKLVYATGVVAALHYGWLVRSDVRRPLAYASVVLVLLASASAKAAGQAHRGIFEGCPAIIVGVTCHRHIYSQSLALRSGRARYASRLTGSAGLGMFETSLVIQSCEPGDSKNRILRSAQRPAFDGETCRPWRDDSAALAAFEGEVLPHADRLFRLAMWLERNRTDAEDVVQETMIEALRSFHRFQPGTNCRAWLVTILQRIVSNRRLAPRDARSWWSDPDDRLAQTVPFVPPGTAGAHRRGRSGTACDGCRRRTRTSSCCATWRISVQRGGGSAGDSDRNRDVSTPPGPCAIESRARRRGSDFGRKSVDP